MVLPSLIASVFVHVLPRSIVRSKCTRHPSCSELVGHSNAPSASDTGLFLIGPKTPSGKRLGADHVLPASPEVISIPHHVLGLGPAL